MEKRKDEIVNKLYEILKLNELSFAEAQDILNSLKYKIHASAKLK